PLLGPTATSEEVLERSTEVKARVEPTGEVQADRVFDQQAGGDDEIDDLDDRRNVFVLGTRAEGLEVGRVAAVGVALRELTVAERFAVGDEWGIDEVPVRVRLSVPVLIRIWIVEVVRRAPREITEVLDRATGGEVRIPRPVAGR